LRDLGFENATDVDGGSRLGLSPGSRLLVGERVFSYTTITRRLSLASLVLTQPWLHRSGAGGMSSKCSNQLS
jgi:hypothetical protein